MNRPLRNAFGLASLLALAACGSSGPPAPPKEAAIAAFATVQQVFQHPRCQNCHIPGDAPLQFDNGLPHEMGVARGPTGHGAQGLPCSTCHGEKNAPASYGPHAPPGAPHWALPPPEHKMVTIGLSAPALCEMIKNKSENGGRDFAALLKHVSEDKLVLWGWEPGGNRVAVPVPHADFVAKFKLWSDAGGPCPAT
ncbi:hypothetical protein DFR29_105159 [Tahibacter aquaticus]|uniref:Cytochrome c domain-containing protein n=1 Tax=Tahibacter aquaticus TaxID=520092 RepID=A0A4V3DMK5_9GAMM|nr:hypothetical protein [Tahibacter aquaticus]TDR44976.1 hypothetical protein DFR29_105159 [Tahibacter aquaticus]